MYSLRWFYLGFYYIAAICTCIYNNQNGNTYFSVIELGFVSKEQQVVCMNTSIYNNETGDLSLQLQYFVLYTHTIILYRYLCSLLFKWDIETLPCASGTYSIILNRHSRLCY
jgi:hypothetical protein